MILNKANGDYCVANASLLQSRYSKTIQFKFTPTLGVGDTIIMATNSTSYFSIVEDTGNLGNYLLQITSNQNGTVVDLLTNIPIFYGVENYISFQQTFTDSTKYVVDIYDMLTGVRTSYGNFYSILDSGKVVLGSQEFDAPVGVSDISFSELEIIAENYADKYNFLQTDINPASLDYISEKNELGNVNTSSIASVRADAVSVDYQNKITITSGGVLQSGINIAITGDLNSPYTTDDSGTIYPELPVGTYSYNVSGTYFTPQASSLVVGVNGKSDLIELVLDPKINTVILSQFIEGTDRSVVYKDGTFMKLPNGETIMSMNDALDSIENFIEPHNREYASVAKLRNANKLNLGSKVSTTSYWGENNADILYNGNGGGATFVCVSNSALEDGYVDNGGTIIVTNNNDALEYTAKDVNDINIAIFGAIGKVNWLKQKSPVLFTEIGTPLEFDLIPSCTTAINNALAWLGRNTKSFTRIVPAKLTFNGHFKALNDYGVDGTRGALLVSVPRGVSIYMEGTSSVHTDFNGVAFSFKNSFRTNSRLNVYFSQWDSAKETWYPKIGDVADPYNTHSEGVRFENCRQCEVEVDIMGFCIGFNFYGKIEGCVENTVRIGSLYDNRYALVGRNDYGGWSTSNYFMGGVIKNRDFQNVDYASSYWDKSNFGIPANSKCAAIVNQGDSTYYGYINMEGNSNTYEYLVYETNKFNTYDTLRYEATSNGSNMVINKTSTLIGGGYYKPEFLDEISIIKSEGVASAALDTVFGGNGIGQGLLSLTGGDGNNNHPKGGTLSLGVENQANKRNPFMNLGYTNLTRKHIFNDDGSIELHTGSFYSDTIKASEWHQTLGIYKEHLIDGTNYDYDPDSYYGVGDWFVTDLQAYHQSAHAIARGITYNIFLPQIAELTVSPTGTQTTIVVDEIFSNTPQQGELIVTQNSGTKTVNYTSWSGTTFTIESTTFTTTDIGNKVDIADGAPVLGTDYVIGDWFRYANWYYAAIRNFTSEGLSNDISKSHIIRLFSTVSPSKIVKFSPEIAYKTLAYPDGIELDINNNILREYGSLAPILLTDQTVQTRYLRGINADKETKPVSIDYGYTDGHTYSGSRSKLVVSTNLSNVQLSGLTSTVFLENTTGTSYQVAFDKVDLLLKAGSPIMLFARTTNTGNITFTTGTTGLTTLNNVPLTLRAGEWVYCAVTSDAYNAQRLREISRKRIDQLNRGLTKIVSDATYTVLETDSKLQFTSATGCVVTLPVTTEVGQEISYFNYCGAAQTVTFANDGTSSIIGGLSTLAYGKYARSEVIDTNIWSLTGDMT